MEEKLDELLELTRESHKILLKMHRAQMWAGVFRFVYWAAIIGTTIGAWYYFQPTIDRYMGTYESLMGKVESLQGNAQGGLNTLTSLLDNPLLKE